MFFFLEKQCLDTLASFSMHGSMNMQMSPTSTHSLRDPLVDLNGRL